jgi:hypothetical protein
MSWANRAGRRDLKIRMREIFGGGVIVALRQIAAPIADLVRDYLDG